MIVKRMAVAALAGVVTTTASALAAAQPAAATADPTETSYTLNVLVLKYFPLTADGQYIDSNVTGDYGDTLANARAHTSSVTANLQAALAKGSTYHGYGDPPRRRRSLGSFNAFESHGHQFEYEFRYLDAGFFNGVYQGPDYPGTGSAPGRCGSVHNPPNATHEYDRNNHTAHASDCLTWYPDGLGTLNQISCLNWGCDGTADNATPELLYDIWWEQNLPGRDNQVYYSGQRMRNWWDIHGNWDAVWAAAGPRLGFTLPGPSAPSCRVGYAISTYTGGFTANLTITNTKATTINGWSLQFPAYGNPSVTNAWGATATQTGNTVTLTNLGYDATIAPGSSVTIGFQGTNAPPARFTLNGSPCQLA